MTVASKQYEIRRVGATERFEIDLIGEIVVTGFPSFDSAATWLREFIMTVVSGQLASMVAAQHRGGKDS